MPRVVHFEVSADDPERAIQFYRQVFGWEITKWEGPMDYWLVDTDPEGEPGINGGIFKRESPVNFVNTIQVPSVDDFARRVSENGGMIMTEKMTIPGVGYLIYFRDTENNMAGIIQPDPNAQP